MTIEELEVLVKQIQKQVELNTLAINSLSDSLRNYTTTSSFYEISTKVNNQDTIVKSIYEDVSSLSIALGQVNKISSMLDTNIESVVKGEILQYDGDRWTNIKPASVIGSSGVSKLEDLIDVKVSGKSDKQALCWDNVSSKWINHTITGGGGSGGLDVAAMWAELIKVDSTRKIDPSHYTGIVLQNNGTANNLTVSTLTTSGNVNMNNSSAAAFNLSTSGVSIKGNTTATGEITAYKIA